MTRYRYDCTHLPTLASVQHPYDVVDKENGRTSTLESCLPELCRDGSLGHGSIALVAIASGTATNRLTTSEGWVTHVVTSALRAVA